MTIRILIADDHPVVRDGLRLTIERSGGDLAVIGEAADGLEVLDWARTNEADVYVLDVTMPNLNGIDTARSLLEAHPASKVLMLSLHDTKAMVEEALAAGARGYLTKETATRNVVDAVSQVHAGRYYLSPSIAHFVVEAGFHFPAVEPATVRPQKLTGQERKVLQLLAEGHCNKEIATVLGISVNTVHSHRNRVMSKLDLHKHADLVRYAIRAGLAKL